MHACVCELKAIAAEARPSSSLNPQHGNIKNYKPQWTTWLVMIGSHKELVCFSRITRSSALLAACLRCIGRWMLYYDCKMLCVTD